MILLHERQTSLLSAIILPLLEIYPLEFNLTSNPLSSLSSETKFIHE